ncbi:MAG: hypothetical protein AMJ38_04730 [Dehalococcoidia bacterium DG_22]|nr:MAG: hypothetical protein AMJ38_04730 [Dehalococcoidia bacterium DG_22]
MPKVHPHRFRHTFATWAIEQQAREIDVQFLLGHSTPAMLRRYTATYNAEKAAQAHALFSAANRLDGGLRYGPLERVTFFLPSRLSRVRFPSPAPPSTRRHNACNARAAEGRPCAL